MAYDLGDTVGLAVDVKDEDGVLTNATTVTLTITKPDGTAVSPAPTVTNPPSATGQYVYDYVPTVAGRHAVRWVFTAPNAAFTDVFDVREAAPPLILSVADAKKHLNIPVTTTTDDEELREHLEAVTRYIESKVGPVVRRTVSEVSVGDYTPGFQTRYRQVLSVTSIVVLRDGSTPVTLAQIDVDATAGFLWLKDGTSFPSEPFRITYVVGRETIPADITLAAKLLLSYTWESQRGPVSNMPLSASAGELLAYGQTIPPRALALLEVSRDRTGFA